MCGCLARGCCVWLTFSSAPESLLISQAAWCTALPLDPLLCPCPQLVMYASLLKLFHSASSHVSSPSEPSHQLMGYHFSIDRVGQVFQGPFCPRSLLLCFSFKEYYWAGAPSSRVRRGSWPHVGSPWKVCIDTPEAGIQLYPPGDVGS